jgi:membrane fusion protein, multidrug efflux system
MQGPNWIVDSGLENGDRVIVQGNEKVHPGMQVKPVAAQLPAVAGGASATPAGGASAASGGGASAPASGAAAG